MPRLLASFRRRFPEAGVVLEVGNRRRVWSLLGARQVDLAIGRRPPAGEPFVTLGHPAGPPGGWRGPSRQSPVRRVNLDELANATWLCGSRARAPGAPPRSWLRELELDPKVLTVGSNGAIVESVQVGLGITLLSRDAAAAELEAGTLVEWRHGRLPLRREWHVVVRAEEELDPTAMLMLEHLGTAGDGGARFILRNPRERAEGDRAEAGS